jgi:hypothetical protein
MKQGEMRFYGLKIRVSGVRLPPWPPIFSTGYGHHDDARFDFGTHLRTHSM